jgi:hypothetical protein
LLRKVERMVPFGRQGRSDESAEMDIEVGLDEVE